MDEAVGQYERRELELGEPVMREVERQVMMKIIDQKWREHLEEMDYLREGINLRAMGQKDPLTEWQREGYSMFEAMMGGVAQDFVRYAMQVQVNVVQPDQPQVAVAPAVEPAATPTEPAAPETAPAVQPTAGSVVPDVLKDEPEPVVQNLSYSAPDEAAAGGGMSAAVRASAVAEGGGTAQPTKAEEPVVNTPVVKSDWDKTPRNAPCPCGSGKKFKMCHGG